MYLQYVNVHVHAVIQKMFSVEKILDVYNKEHPNIFLLENLLHEIFQNENFPIYSIIQARHAMP